MSYRVVGDRKAAAKRMEVMTGERPVYTRVPRCAYILNGIAIEKDGTVTTEEGADMDLVQDLVDDGVFEKVEDEEPTSTPAEDEETPVQEEETPAPVETAEEAQTEEEEATEEEHTEELAEEQTEETVEEQEESTEGQQEEPAASRYASLIEHEPEPVKPSFSFPLSQHSMASIRNLVFTIYSRGALISKSTGGDFYVSDDFADKVDSGMLLKKEDILSVVREAKPEDLRGITFSEDKVTFDGFPETIDPDRIKAWGVLSEAMNKTAIRQKHVHAKRADMTNELFSFRIWLGRLQLDGSEYKAVRKLLYANLSGHTAFRTPADEEKWKARQAEKREALRAAKRAIEESTDAEENENSAE